jgi:hypothetical protein
MNGKSYLTAGILAFSLLCSGIAQAMSIHDFGRMNNDDDATYVTLLVEGAAKILRANGQPDLAQKAINFFKDSSKSGGVNQFAINLKMINALNNRNAINPNNRVPVYQVEDAMALTLKDNGMIIPVSALLTINKNFQPSGPPRSQMIRP